jgi:LysR family transcriptional regulator, transcription activator of glutamate synthase operon
MEIDHLKEFVVLAEVGNYLEASDRLFISQSSLSKHIQGLEEELGVQLFDRTTRKIRLSQCGEVFLPYAQEIVKTEESGLEAVNKALEANSKVFSLGIIPSIDSYGISEILSDFGKNTKGFKVKLLEEDTSVLMDMLKEEKISMAFAYCLGSGDPAVAYVPLLTDRLVCVCSKKNKTLPLERMPVKDLQSKRFVLLEGHTVLCRLVSEACKAAGFTPESVSTRRRFLSSYDLDDDRNIAIFFNKDATYVNNPGNRIIELEPPPTCQMALCYLKKHKLTEEEKFLLECARKKAIPE